MRTPRSGARRPVLKASVRRLMGLCVVVTLVAAARPVHAGEVVLAQVGLEAAQAQRVAPLSPAGADGMRDAIRASVKDDVDAGNYARAAAGLAENAALLGDPVTFVEAGAMHLKQAEKDRDIEQCRAAIKVTNVGLDVLFFYNDVAADKNSTAWLVIDPASAAKMIGLAEAQRADAEALIETIEAEQEAAAAAGRVKPAAPVVAEPEKRQLKPGTGMLIGGVLGTVAGVGGVSLVIAGVMIGNGKQADIDSLMSPGDDDEITTLDDEGKSANRLAIIGAGVAAVGLGVGVPLLLVGVKKRRTSGPADTASVQLAPMVARGARGLALAGRF